jgi:hypothetical protein
MSSDTSVSKQRDAILDALDDLARDLGLLQTEVARIKRLIKEDRAADEVPTVRPPSQTNIPVVRISKNPQLKK